MGYLDEAFGKDCPDGDIQGTLGFALKECFLVEFHRDGLSSRYTKLHLGDNRFRILGPAILGMEGWKQEGDVRRPVRKRLGQNFGISEVDEPDKIKHFWAMPVWNYRERSVQVFEVTQKTIQRAIKALSRNNDWGDPTGYDIAITREGEGLDTEYIVSPLPPAQMDQATVDAWQAAKRTLDLTRLYENEDPFVTDGA